MLDMHIYLFLTLFCRTQCTLEINNFAIKFHPLLFDFNLIAEMNQIACNMYRISTSREATSHH
jgi:hypothetical protein